MLRTMTHLSRDETAPKMGHPIVVVMLDYGHHPADTILPPFPHFHAHPHRFAPLLRLALLALRAYPQTMPYS